MAQFNIDGHLSNGKHLDWLALADEGESPEDVVNAVRWAAVSKFGTVVSAKRWTNSVASNGYITVRMHA